jgi:hypothetical protein
LRGASSDEDSDDEDEKIKVLSAKDKRWFELARGAPWRWGRRTRPDTLYSFAEMDAAITSIQNATKSGGAASTGSLRRPSSTSSSASSLATRLP